MHFLPDPKYFHEDTTSRKLPACRTSANDEVVMPNEVETCQKKSISRSFLQQQYKSSQACQKNKNRTTKNCQEKTESL
ncbi:uncharacterized protein LOC144424578 isoform X2 [Styela clava]